MELTRVQEESFGWCPKSHCSLLAVAKSLQEAADVLGIDQATLWRRRKKYGI